MIVVGVIVLLILMGIGAFVLGNKQNTPATVQNVAQNNPSPTSGNVITSIKDALANSQSLECTYADDKGTTNVAYIKNGAIRSDFTGTTPQESGSVIMKDNKMYFWNGKTGFMMTFDPSQLGTVTPGTQKVTPGQKNPNDVVEDLEKYKQNCKQATVDDSLFVPPTDVKFTDFSSLMNQGSKTGTAGGAITEEQIKQLQQQFQQ